MDVRNMVILEYLHTVQVDYVDSQKYLYIIKMC